MFNETNLPKYFWADVITTAYYAMNCVLIRTILKLTPYEFYKGRKPDISHLHVFKFKCCILNNGNDNLEKFNVKACESIFLEYSTSSKKFRVFY